MTILHITNWYPSKPTPQSAPWIQSHIKALSMYAFGRIYHLEIRTGKINLDVGKNEDGSSYFIINLPFSIWSFNEVLSFFMVIWVIFQNRNKNFDVINFHIAYPNCTYLHLIKRWIKCPVVITEHWSEYHYHFHIKNPKKAQRIKRIFNHNIPLIAVSRSLSDDIKRFAMASFDSYIIPNAIDTDIFRYQRTPEARTPTLFAISQWKWPKDPFLLLKSWKIIQRKYPQLRLVIGGYGPQWKEMQNISRDLGILNSVDFRGKMGQKHIAKEMNMAVGFIHISEYETFSVVCAEALCCGTPVIASNVGGIKEMIDKSNGILTENDESSIVDAVIYLIENQHLYVKKDIFTSAAYVLNRRAVGHLYHETIQKIILQQQDIIHPHS